MAITADSQESFAAIGNKEDLSDVIYDVTPTETPFMSSMNRVGATGTKHEWQTGSLAAAAANSQLEGDTLTNNAPTQNARVFNYTTISTKVVDVSGTQESVSSAGRGSDMAHEMAKKMKEIKLDVELMMFANTAQVAGNATLARVAGGLQTWTTTNVSEASDATGSAGDGSDIHTDGTARALQESFVEDVLGTAWSNGGYPTIGYLNKFQKQKFSDFSGNQTRTLDGATKKITNSVDVYIDPLGSEIRLVPSRQVPADVIHFVDPEYVAMATLRDFHTSDLAKTSDSERKAIIAEWTLEVRNEKAHAAIYDLTSS